MTPELDGSQPEVDANNAISAANPKVHESTETNSETALMDRRTILVLAGVSSAAGAMSLIYPFSHLVRRGKSASAASPRFGKSKPWRIKTDLKSGFYTNPSTGVVHYVRNDGIISGAPKIDVQKLSAHRVGTLKDVPQLGRVKSSADLPRINLRQASYACEQKALEKVRAKEYKSACDWLMVAIRHDLAFRNRNRGQLPSFRVYDLLALVATRYNEETFIEEMVELIQEIKAINKTSSSREDPRIFDTRLMRWRDSQSAWYRRAVDPEIERKWNNIVLDKPMRGEIP